MILLAIYIIGAVVTLLVCLLYKVVTDYALDIDEALKWLSNATLLGLFWFVVLPVQGITMIVYKASRSDWSIELKEKLNW